MWKLACLGRMAASCEIDCVAVRTDSARLIVGFPVDSVKDEEATIPRPETYPPACEAASYAYRLRKQCDAFTGSADRLRKV